MRKLISIVPFKSRQFCEPGVCRYSWSRTICSVMGLKLLQSTGTFLTTIWTVPIPRSAVPAGVAF